MVLRGSGRREGGNGEWLFNSYRVLVLKNEKSSRDWLHENVNVLNTIDSTLKNG